MVEKSIPDVRQLEADIEAFKKKHPDNALLCDEFDVLCIVDGQKARLPFSKRHLGKNIPAKLRYMGRFDGKYQK